MAERKLSVVITGDAKGAQKAMGQVESSAGGMQSKLTKVGGGITTAFKGAALGAGLVGGGLAVFGNQLLTSGAQVAAWRQKTNVVFEGQAGDVRKWADKNNEAFGLTDDELAGLAASFGDLLKPMGFTAGQAADMSTKVVGLSGALSSWSGGTVSAADASDILAKAMLGETDGLKSLGIAISAADIDARLAAKGQDKLTGAALAQAKAVATQELIFEKSTDAQKAWSDGGNKALLGQNKLKAVIAEVKETIATGLTPVLATAAGWLGDNLPKALTSARDLFDQMKPAISGVASSVSSFADAVRPAFEAIVSFVQSNPAPVLAAIGAVAAAAFGAWAISAGAAAVATLAAAAPVLLLVGAIALIAGGLVYAYQHFEGFRNVVDGVASWLTGTALPAIQSFAKLVAEGFGKLVGWVQEHWGQIKGYVEGAINTVATVVGGVIDGIKVAWQTWGDELVTIAQTYWAYIKGTVENAIKLVKGVIDVVMGVIRGDWSKAWDGIKGIVGAVWDQIKLAAETGLKILATVISAAWDGLKAVARAAWDGFKKIISDAIDGAVSFAKSLPGRVVAAIGNLNDKLYQAGKDLIGGLVRGITDSIPSVSGVLGSVTNMIPDWKGPPSKDATLLKPAGHLIIKGLVDGINAGVPVLKSTLSSISSMIATAASENVAAFWRAQSMINSATPGSQANADGTYSQWWVGTKYEDSEYAKWIAALENFFSGGTAGPAPSSGPRPSDGAKAIPAMARAGASTYVTIQMNGPVLDGRELGRLAAEGLNEYGVSQNQPIIATSLVG